MIYPFWELGEDRYQEEYKLPEVDCVNHNEIEKIISDKLNVIYDDICYMSVKFPFLNVDKRNKRSTDLIEVISIYNENPNRVYNTRLQNNNICSMRGSYDFVYKLGQNHSIGYKITILIICHWNPLNIYNEKITNFEFSYETLYFILKDCEAVWNTNAYIK